MVQFLNKNLHFAVIFIVIFVKIKKSVSACVAGCISCPSNVCNACIQSYFLHTNKNCYYCQNSIALCNSCQFISPSVICDTCTETYFLFNNTCISCLPECQTCLSKTNCLSCQLKQYLAINQCINCSLFCDTCNGPTDYYCSKCISTHKKIDNICCDNSCESCENNYQCKTCQLKYYLAGIAQLCAACNQIYCLECIGNPLNCTVCLDIQKQKLIYNPITYSNKCCHQDCSDCTLPSQQSCTKCQNNLVLRPKPIVVEGPCCHPFCQDCIGAGDNQCIKCPSSRYKDFYLPPLNNANYGFCCPQNCTQCITSYICTACINGNWLDIADNLCKPCHSTCSLCISGPNENQCIQCPTSRKPSQSGETICCYASCKTCESPYACKTCIENQFINSAQQNECTNCSEKCQECFQQPTSCTSCDSSNQLELRINQKICCKSSCLNCNDITVNNCTQCDDTKNLTLRIDPNMTIPGQRCCHNSCEFCIANEITNNYCTLCQKNLILYYVSPTNSSIPYGYCCFHNCDQCYGHTNEQCLNCKSGFIKDQQTNLCCDENCKLNKCFLNSSSITIECQECILGMGFDQTVYQCVTCHSSCLTCNSNSYSNCTSCQQGKKLDKNNQVIKCCHSDCNDCKTDAANYTDQCKNCQSQYFFNASSQYCQNCHADCLECVNNSRNSCLSCITSNKVTLSLRIIQDNVGMCCHETCLQCYGQTQYECTTCQSPRFLTLTNKNESICCHQNCLDNGNSSQSCFGTSANECILCGQNKTMDYKSGFCCNNFCTNCSNPLAGLPCSKCMVTYIINSTNQCQSCHDTCLTCQNLTISSCSSCKGNRFFDSTLKTCCHQNCSSCEIPPLNESSTYVHEKCKTCSDTFYLNASSTICEKCHSNCFNCYNFQNCTTCESPKVLKMTLEQCCHQECKTCNLTNYEICLSCEDGIVQNFTNNVCCPANCTNCENFFNCNNCNISFYKNEAQQCEKCHVSCKTCFNSSSPNNCDQCYTIQESTVLNIKNRTKNLATNNTNPDYCCLDTCKKCSAPEYCDECQDNRYLHSLYKTCDVCHPDCNTCLGPNRDQCDKKTNTTQPCKGSTLVFRQKTPPLTIGTCCHQNCKECSDIFEYNCTECDKINLFIDDVTHFCCSGINATSNGCLNSNTNFDCPKGQYMRQKFCPTNVPCQNSCQTPNAECDSCPDPCDPMQGCVCQYQCADEIINIDCCQKCNDQCQRCYDSESFQNCIQCKNKNQLYVLQVINYIYIGICCHESCGTCSNSNGLCDSCKENRTMVNYICCPSNCQKCTNITYQTCDECASKYFWEKQSQKCLKCHEDCLTCIDPTQFGCKQCNNSIIIKLSQENNCCHQFCRSCIGIQPNQCKTCFSDRIKSKPEGPMSYADFCCSQTCKNCTNENSCDHCAQFHFKLEDNTCKKCFESCESCYGESEKECITCKSEFNSSIYNWTLLNQSLSLNYRNKLSKLKPDLCNATDIEICKQYDMIVYFNDLIYSALTLYQINITNVKPFLCCHQNCQTCYNSSKYGCIKCLYQQKTFINSTGQCCMKNCLQCDENVLLCEKCQDKYFFDQKLQICQQCHESCLTCFGIGEDQCLSCSPEMNYDSKKNKCCHSSCQSCQGQEYYQCTECSINRKIFFRDETHQYCCNRMCKDCDHPDKCKNCIDGYYYNATDLQCNLCHSSCLTCSGPADKECLSCSSGITYNKQNLNIVRYCCNPTCKTCNNSLTCISCQQNQYININGLCQNCEKNCKNCTEKDGCIICETGYFQILRLNKINVCETQCPDDTYQKQSRCIECQKNTYEYTLIDVYQEIPILEQENEHSTNETNQIQVQKIKTGVKCKKKIFLNPVLAAVKNPLLFNITFQNNQEWIIFFDKLIEAPNVYSIMKINQQSHKNYSFSKIRYKYEDIYGDEDGNENFRFLQEELNSEGISIKYGYHLQVKIEIDTGVMISQSTPFNLQLIPSKSLFDEQPNYVLENSLMETQLDLYVECGSQKTFDINIKGENKCRYKQNLVKPMLFQTTDPATIRVVFSGGELPELFFLNLDYMVKISKVGNLSQSDYSYKLVPGEPGSGEFFIKFDFNQSFSDRPEIIVSFDLLPQFQVNEELEFLKANATLSISNYEKLTMQQQDKYDKDKATAEIAWYIFIISIYIAGLGTNSYNSLCLIFCGSLLWFLKFLHADFSIQLDAIFLPISLIPPNFLFSQNIFGYNVDDEDKLPLKYKKYNISPYFINNHLEAIIQMVFFIIIAYLTKFLSQWYLKKPSKQNQSSYILYCICKFICNKFQNIAYLVIISRFVPGCLFSLLNIVTYPSSGSIGLLSYILSFASIVFYIIFIAHVYFISRVSLEIESGLLVKQIKEGEAAKKLIDFGKIPIAEKSVDQPVEYQQYNLQDQQNIEFLTQKRQELLQVQQSFQYRMYFPKEQKERLEFMEQNAIIFSDFKNDKSVKKFVTFIQLLKCLCIIFIALIMEKQPFYQSFTILIIQLVFVGFYIFLRPQFNIISFIVTAALEIIVTVAFSGSAALGYYDQFEMSGISYIIKRQSISNIIILSCFSALFASIAISLISLFKAFRTQVVKAQAKQRIIKSEFFKIDEFQKKNLKTIEKKIEDKNNDNQQLTYKQKKQQLKGNKEALKVLEHNQWIMEKQSKLKEEELAKKSKIIPVIQQEGKQKDQVSSIQQINIFETSNKSHKAQEEDLSSFSLWKQSNQDKGSLMQSNSGKQLFSSNVKQKIEQSQKNELPQLKLSIKEQIELAQLEAKQLVKSRIEEKQQQQQQ